MAHISREIHTITMSSYRRVLTADSASNPAPPNNEEAYYGKRKRSERISDKVYALAWVTVAGGTAIYTQFAQTLFSDDRIIRPLFNIGIALFFVNFILTIYLTVYLPQKFPKTPKFNVSASSPEFWGVYCPNVITSMFAIGAIASLLLVRSCFDIWGFLTPLIMTVIAMGVFYSLHFIPWW